MKRTIIQLSFGLGVLAFAAGCQDHLWDDHYGIDGSTETRTLMQVLESRPEYSAFCEVVRSQGIPCCPRTRPLRCGLRPMRPWRVM